MQITRKFCHVRNGAGGKGKYDFVECVVLIGTPYRDPAARYSPADPRPDGSVFAGSLYESPGHSGMEAGRCVIAALVLRGAAVP
jgi:hypothetical protein